MKKLSLLLILLLSFNCDACNKSNEQTTKPHQGTTIDSYPQIEVEKDVATSTPNSNIPDGNIQFNVTINKTEIIETIERTSFAEATKDDKVKKITKKNSLLKNDKIKKIETKKNLISKNDYYFFINKCIDIYKLMELEEMTELQYIEFKEKYKKCMWILEDGK